MQYMLCSILWQPHGTGMRGLQSQWLGQSAGLAGNVTEIYELSMHPEAARVSSRQGLASTSIYAATLYKPSRILNWRSTFITTPTVNLPQNACVHRPAAGLLGAALAWVYQAGPRRQCRPRSDRLPLQPVVSCRDPCMDAEDLLIDAR